MPAFYREEKMDKFYRHWAHRLGLEVIKMKQAVTTERGNREHYRRNKAELEAFIANAYAEEH